MTQTTHDPLCPPAWRLDDQVPEDDCPFCRLIAKVESRTLHEIAKVRAEEREQAAQPNAAAAVRGEASDE